ncbi:MAG: hypothetical protein ACKOFT_10055, partial [Actinomycetota bacterium]
RAVARGRVLLAVGVLMAVSLQTVAAAAPREISLWPDGRTSRTRGSGTPSGQSEISRGSAAATLWILTAINTPTASSTSPRQTARACTNPGLSEKSDVRITDSPGVSSTGRVPCCAAYQGD